MIKSPYKYVAPEQELTRLTLMTSTAAENIRRRSTIGSSRPLGTLNGLAVQGPLWPPPGDNKGASNDQPMLSPSIDEEPERQNILTARQEETDRSTTISPERPSDVDMDGSGDNSSEVTLVSTPSVDDSVMVDSAAKPVHLPTAYDKDSQPPSNNGVPAESTTISLQHAVPPNDPQPSTHDAQENNNAHSSAQQHESATSIAQTISPEPPNRPPPVPPRPQQAAPQTHTLEEYARQQDVTEVLNHVLFQLSCAIKPVGFDEEGEQMDQVKALFYGKTKQHIMSADKDEAKNDTFCSIIVRLFSLPVDIYAALDGYFDVEEIANKKRFLSISRLPPIFQIQIDRAGLDQKKNNHHIELKETIYLDRYLEEDTNPALMERREEAWVWKKELAELENRQVELTANQVCHLQLFSHMTD
jgi:ubiquitin carboxyl-terminal hydrolase 25